jgi:peptide/nickel transport system substrate-binding protein
MFDSRQAGGALDYAGYHTPHLDSLFAAARSARTDAERTSVWHAIQQTLADATPVAWLYHSRGVQGVSARLRNVVMDLRGEMVTLARWETTQQQ